MRWRVVTAALLLAGLLAGGLFCRGLVEDCCDRAARLLETACAQLEAGQTPVWLVEESLEHWEKHLPLLSSLMHHEALEAVGQGLSRAAGYVYLEDFPAGLAQLREVLYLLDDIRNFDRPVWKTLF